MLRLHKAVSAILGVAVAVGVSFITCAPALAQTSGAVVAQAAPPSTEMLSDVLKKYVPKDVPILEDINITRPDQSVPQGLAGLSGVWVGEWRGEKTNSHMMDHVYVFEKISSTSITVVSMGIGRFVSSGSSSNYGKTWANRYELEPVGTSPLAVVLPNGNKVTFQLKDGQLKTRSVRPSGSAHVGTFKKVR